MVLAVGECYKDEMQHEKMIQEIGVSDVFDLRLQFVTDSEVASYSSAADIVALPYRSATQSGIVQIAHHFNKPVLVTNVGGLPEMYRIKKWVMLWKSTAPIPLLKESSISMKRTATNTW